MTQAKLHRGQAKMKAKFFKPRPSRPDIPTSRILELYEEYGQERGFGVRIARELGIPSDMVYSRLRSLGKRRRA